MRSLYAVVFVLFTATTLHGLDTRGSVDPSPPRASPGQGSGAAGVKTDRNDDGVPDAVVYFDRRGKKEREEFDYNYDGVMDDFLIYSDGIPSREEVDSDFDGKVDIWVYLSDGIYVQKYERDLDADGIADVVKDFGKGK